MRFAYTVQNASAAPIPDVAVKIAVPRDCATQKVTEFVREAPPDAQSAEQIDQYGQPVISYKVSLAPGESRSFGYSCNVSVSSMNVSLDRNRVGSLNEIPKEIRDLYCVDVPRVYDLGNPLIANLGDSFSKRFPNLVDRVLAVHSYVSSNITYNSEDGWESAPKVLSTRSGSCSEFSYLFCALLRRSGIPTRFAAGSRLRGSVPYTDKEGHRWSEVYLPRYGWVPFDPTMDSKHPSRPLYIGAFFTPSLITTRGGGESNQLRNAYNGTSDHRNVVPRKKTFVWLERW